MNVEARRAREGDISWSFIFFMLYLLNSKWKLGELIGMNQEKSITDVKKMRVTVFQKYMNHQVEI